MVKNLNGKSWIIGIAIPLLLLALGTFLLKLPLKHEREIGEIKTEQVNAKEERKEIKTEIKEQRKILQDVQIGQELMLDKFRLLPKYEEKCKENNTE